MSVFDRLCDSSKYTGAHKHRFDENGNGRGLAGRDRVAKGHGHIAGNTAGGVNDLSQITRTNLNSGTGAGYAYAPMKAGIYAPPPRQPSASGALTPSLAAGRSTLRTSDEGGAPRKASIFDKLTDPSQYTGAHRHRFSSSGYGMGAQGRTTPNAYVSAHDLMKRF